MPGQTRPGNFSPRRGPCPRRLGIVGAGPGLNRVTFPLDSSRCPCDLPPSESFFAPAVLIFLTKKGRRRHGGRRLHSLLHFLEQSALRPGKLVNLLLQGPIINRTNKGPPSTAKKILAVTDSVPNAWMSVRRVFTFCSSALLLAPTSVPINFAYMVLNHRCATQISASFRYAAMIVLPRRRFSVCRFAVGS